MSHRKEKNPKLPLKLRNELRGARDPYAQLARLRQSIPSTLYPGLVEWLPNAAARERGMVEGRFPRVPNAIQRAKRPLAPVSLANEVLWCAYLLIRHRDVLTKFVTCARTFDAQLLMGKYGSCGTTLDSIQDELGHSFWLIETRLALLGLSQGLEAQKAYARQIRSSVEPGFIGPLTFYFSYRNEETTDPRRFGASMVNAVRAWHLTDELTAYVNYRIADYWQMDAASLGMILRIEELSPVIDLYETLVRLATRTIAGQHELAALFLPGLHVLADAIDDLRLQKLLFLQEPHPSDPPCVPLPCLRATNALLEGRFSESVKQASSGTCLKEVQTISALAGSCAQLGIAVPGSTTLAAKIATLLCALTTKLQGVDDVVSELGRLALNFRFTNFASAIKAHTDTQVSSDPLPNDTNTLESFINSATLDPEAATALSGPRKLIYSARLRADTSCSAVSVQLAKALVLDASANELDGISLESHFRVQLEAAYRLREYEKVLTLAEKAIEVTNSELYRVAARFKANAFIQLQRMDECMEHIVNCCLYDLASIYMLPVAQVVDWLDRQTRRRLAGSLCTPILLDLFTRHVDDRRADIRDYAYEDFLLAHGVQRPSELRPCMRHFRSDHLTYYLRYVCVPAVMQVSIAFQSSRELEDERIVVCTMLSELDDVNSSKYESELRDIARRQIIEGGIRQVEQSKISIDIEPLRRLAERNLKESFQRYQSLRAAGLVSTTDAIDNAYHDADRKPPKSDEIPEAPSDESASLLVSMIRALLTECYTNPHHGLDCYLSMRVRHGALSGQLRAPLENEKIVTQRQGDSDDYAENDYWIGELAKRNQLIAREVDKRLRTFSRQYDTFIDSFAKEYIQIQSPERPKGLFESSVPTKRVALLMYEIQADTTFDGFLDLWFAAFWENVDASLRRIRDHISTSLKSELNSMFMALLSDIESLTAQLFTPDLDNAIRAAQTGALQALEEVKDWFRPPKPLPPRDFSFEQLVDIGLQQVKKAHREFSPMLDLSIDEMPRFVELTRFSDIFYLIFGNIQRHSGLDDPSVQIVATIRDHVLHICVENQVAPQSRTLEIEKRVEGIRNTVASDAYQRIVRSEGGTGLIKLRNACRVEGETVSRIDFGFTPRDTFVVNISLPVRSYELLPTETENESIDC